ncbi:Chromate resistance protein ChrB [Streptomyces sp. TRM72054]|uniref:Chromate resistance protein ChrB n=1 Tax=Streptomyces sp. TRM72054 TaxID=2870562 RepID=UPI0027E0B6B3|nr:Chromate resistance protein ChrB [Streptomyces sp. TRM72054]
MQVWRKLKGLGALYVQQSVCLLPSRPAVVDAVRARRGRAHIRCLQISGEAEARGPDLRGTATTLRTGLPERAQQWRAADQETTNVSQHGGNCGQRGADVSVSPSTSRPSVRSSSASPALARAPPIGPGTPY